MFFDHASIHFCASRAFGKTSSPFSACHASIHFCASAAFASASEAPPSAGAFAFGALSATFFAGVGAGGAFGIRPLFGAGVFPGVPNRNDSGLPPPPPSFFAPPLFAPPDFHESIHFCASAAFASASAVSYTHLTLPTKA